MGDQRKALSTFLSGVGITPRLTAGVKPLTPASTVNTLTLDTVDLSDLKDLPPDLVALLAEPVEVGKRSDRLFHLVGECYRAGLTQAQTVAAITPWCATVSTDGKYTGRAGYHVGLSWPKVQAAAEWEAGLADGEPTASNDAVDQHNSWQRQAVDAILDGTHVPEAAALLPRDDGVGLFYAGRTHSIHAESESGKSLLVQHEAARLLNAGQSVAYLDFESDAASVVRRLLDLGADPEAIRQRFDYRRPEVAPAPGRPEGVEWAGLLRTEYALVIVDGVTEAMDILAPKSPGGDLNERIAGFLRRYPGRIAEHTGAAVVLIDHVVKNTENRGRHAYGGQHKMNGLTGAAYTVEVKTQPRRGHVGELHLFVAKDRPAGIRPHCGPMRPDRTQLAAVVTIDSTGERMKVSVAAPGMDVEAGSTTFRPTFLMERVSRWLQAHPGAHSRTEITDTVQGNKSALLTALDVLAAEGYVTVTEQPRGTKMIQRDYTFVRLFTEDDDPGPGGSEPETVPTVLKPFLDHSKNGHPTNRSNRSSPLLGGTVDGNGLDPVPERQQTADTVPAAAVVQDGTPAVCPECLTPHGQAADVLCIKCYRLSGGGL